MLIELDVYGSFYPQSVRPPQLENRDWLARRYAVAGDRAIAKELGCAPATVLAARRRLGIMPAPEGRRRGRPVPSAAQRLRAVPAGFPELADEMIDTSSLPAMLVRFAEDQRTKAPATRDLLIARCKGWLEAERHHDRLSTADALLSIASAALLVHQHLEAVRTHADFSI